jgi:DNA-3-methyladenine glycosylase II
MKSKIKINYKNLRPLTPTQNPFGSLVSSIIYQQLSGKAAGTIERRFLELFPKKKNGYPTPEDILKLTDEQFRSVGVSSQKMGYLRDLAQKFIDGTIEPKKLPKMSDLEIKEHLIRVKGIGSWTADMFLIFALNRPNILPVGDLAIVKGFQKAWNLRTIPSKKKMRELARDFEGKYTYLSLHLWGIMDEGKK